MKSELSAVKTMHHVVSISGCAHSAFPCRAILLAVGGAEEALLSRKGTFDLVLKKRKVSSSTQLCNECLVAAYCYHV